MYSVPLGSTAGRGCPVDGSVWLWPGLSHSETSPEPDRYLERALATGWRDHEARYRI